MNPCASTYDIGKNKDIALEDPSNLPTPRVPIPPEFPMRIMYKVDLLFVVHQLTKRAITITSNILMINLANPDFNG